MSRLGRMLFDSQGRERLGASAERFAAASRAPRTGHVLPLGVADPPEWYPPRPEVQRDLQFERSWTRQAGESARARTIEQLITFAEARAGDGPVRELADRDFAREIREELADARNYLVWAARQEMANSEPDGEMTAAIAQTLACVTQAFDGALKIRDLRVGR